MKKTTIMQALAGALLVCGSGAACADQHAMLDDWSVSLGLFSNNNKATIQGNGYTSGGTDINVDRDLGVGGTSSLPFFAASWRPWERHEFFLAYYSDSKSNTRTLQRDITFQGETFTLGGSLETKFSYDAYGIGYTYWAWIGDEGAFGLTGGLEDYSLELKLTGSASIAGGGGGVGGSATAKASTDIPDPFIGINYRYQMTDWARLVLIAGAFKAKIDNIDATLYNGTAGVEFYPWQNIGIVTQYGFNRINADLTKNDFSGKADLHFQGLQALLKIRF